MGWQAAGRLWRALPGSTRSLGLWWRNREPLNDCEEGRVRCSAFEEITLTCLEDARERAPESDNAPSTGMAKGMEGRDGFCPFNLPFPRPPVMLSYHSPPKKHFLHLTSYSRSLPFSFPCRHLERAVYSYSTPSHSSSLTMRLLTLPGTHSDLSKPTKELNL